MSFVMSVFLCPRRCETTCTGVPAWSESVAEVHYVAYAEFGIAVIELSRSRGGGTCKLSRTGEPNWGHFACAFFAAAHRPSRESRRAGRVKGFARFARRLRRPGHDLRAMMRVTMGDGRTGASGRGSGLRVLHGKPAAVNSLASNPFPLFFRATGARRD